MPINIVSLLVGAFTLFIGAWLATLGISGLGVTSKLIQPLSDMFWATVLIISGIGTMLKKTWARIVAIPPLVVVSGIFLSLVTGFLQDYLKGGGYDQVYAGAAVFVYSTALICTMLSLIYLFLSLTRQLFRAKSK